MYTHISVLTFDKWDNPICIILVKDKIMHHVCKGVYNFKKQCYNIFPLKNLRNLSDEIIYNVYSAIRENDWCPIKCSLKDIQDKFNMAEKQYNAHVLELKDKYS